MGVASKSLPVRENALAVWRRTLLQIPTVFGRLVYLASLRDPHTGRYAHFSLTPLIGPEESDRTLCHSHHQVFAQWIGFSLAEQKADLEVYVSQPGGRQNLLDQYLSAVPPAAREVERELYLTDLETLIGLLRYSSGGGYAIPGA